MLHPLRRTMLAYISLLHHTRGLYHCQNDSFESPRLLHHTRRICPAKPAPPAGERQYMPADSFLVSKKWGNHHDQQKS